MMLSVYENSFPGLSSIPLFQPLLNWRGRRFPGFDDMVAPRERMRFVRFLPKTTLDLHKCAINVTDYIKMCSLEDINTIFSSPFITFYTIFLGGVSDKLLSKIIRYTYWIVNSIKFDKTKCYKDIITVVNKGARANHSTKVDISKKRHSSARWNIIIHTTL